MSVGNPLLRTLMLALALLAIGGCAQLSQPGDASTNLSRSHRRSMPTLADISTSPDGVALEIAVAQLDGHALDLFYQVWEKADVQSLPLSTRKLLDQNGIRIGLLGAQLPGELTAAFNWRKPLLTEDGDVLFNSRNPLPPANNQGPFAIKQIEQLKQGESHWVPCSPRMAEIPWQVETGDTYRSGVCRLAQCGFMLSQTTSTSDSIKLWFRPEIRHGESRMRYGVDHETLLAQERQERLRLDELDFHHPLRLGQTLMISATPTPRGTGQNFFAAGQYSTSRQVLLIRPVRIGRDDLFGPEQTSRRLATSLD